MKTKTVILFFLFVFSSIGLSYAQQTSIEGDTLSLETQDIRIYGTLRNPSRDSKVPVALIVAGSGPTDRNGNNPQMQNNSLKFLAEGLYQNGIASLTYDKRAIGESLMPGVDESKLTIDMYMDDASKWVNKLKEDNRFSEVVVIGHSEGGLINLVVANENENIDKLVLLATPSKNYGDIVMEQLENDKLPKEQLNLLSSYVKELKAGNQIPEVDSQWHILFRPSIQPFLISVMKYEPTALIRTITKPILIVQGSTDIQVSLNSIDELSKANPKANKAVLKNMNHVLKDCKSTDQQTQILTYVNPDLPINSKLMTEIVGFINK